MSVLLITVQSGAEQLGPGRWFMSVPSPPLRLLKSFQVYEFRGPCCDVLLLHSGQLWLPFPQMDLGLRHHGPNCPAPDGCFGQLYPPRSQDFHVSSLCPPLSIYLLGNGPANSRGSIWAFAFLFTSRTRDFSSSSSTGHISRKRRKTSRHK